MRLRYTLPALADLDAILDYIAASSPQSARRVQARVQVVIDLLLLHPQIGTRTVELVADVERRFPHRARPIRMCPHEDGSVVDM